VESSTNLGTIRTEPGRIQLMATITAGLSTCKHAIAAQTTTLADLTGGTSMVFGLDAPEFPYNPDSELLRRARDAYLDTMGHEPEIHVSNCSLELGMFTRRLPGLDTISVGTDLSGLHSPAERVSHRSIARVARCQGPPRPGSPPDLGPAQRAVEPGRRPR
jgi:dipeptidase D